MQLSSRQYHALPTHCHPCSVSQCHWAGKRKFGELSPIGDTDAPIEFSHQFRKNDSKIDKTPRAKLPLWAGRSQHDRSGWEISCTLEVSNAALEPRTIIIETQAKC